MKKTSILFAFTFILSSCYSYVAFDPENAELLNNNINTNLVGNKLTDVRNTNVQILEEKDISNAKNKAKEKTKIPSTELDLSTIKITDIIKTNQFYKIEVNNKFYKIEAKQWKADTLYAIEKAKPAHELKFHKDEIKDIKIRKFSKGKSDALTVAAYVLGIFLLLK